MIEKGDLPPPSNWQLVRLERVAADRALAVRSRTSSPCVNTASQRPDAMVVNTPVCGVETNPAAADGIVFPGAEAPTFKSGVADRMTKVFISYAHSSPEHKQTVSRLVDDTAREGANRHGGYRC